MSTQYPPFNMEDDPSSRFLDLFNRFQSQQPDIGNYLQPDDPDLLKYQQLSSTPTGSEKLISDYIDSRPEREDPSFGRKLAATLIGGLSGQGSKGSRDYLDHPYNEAIEDWKAEGANISSRARLIDAERGRELTGLKYGIQNKVNSEKSRVGEEKFKEQESRRVANEVLMEEDRRNKEEQRIKEHEEAAQRAREIFDFHKEVSNWQKQQDILKNTERAAAAKKKAEDDAAKASDLGLKNKKLFDYASRQGIDTDSKSTALDIAKHLAIRKAFANPNFKHLIVEDPNTPSGLNFKDPTDPASQPAKAYIYALAQKIMNGDY